MSEKPRLRRLAVIVAVAGVAGILAGSAAVYVSQSGIGNFGAPGAGVPDCASALAAASRLKPLATGEVAAFRPAEAGQGLGDLAFRTPDGVPTTLAAFKGKIVLLNLWATWCVPCRAEMPALDRLQGAMGSDAFMVAAVNVDVGAAERSKAFLRQLGVSHLAFYADPTLGIFNALKKRGLAIGLPTTLLIDGNGCQLGIMEGPAAWDSPDGQALIGAALRGA